MLKCTRWLTVIVLCVSMQAGTLSAASPTTVAEAVANSNEEYKLWYCKVTCTVNGKTQVGYLGGYESEAIARQQFKNWAKGVGSRAYPQLVKVYSE